MKTYYYAGGSKIELQDDEDHIAVDRSAAPATLFQNLVDGAGASRNAEVLVASKADIDAKGMAALREAGALLPVFRHGRAMLVPMPEVRVEVDDPKQRSAVKKFVSTKQTHMVIAEESDDRLVLKPASGSGVDALNAANAIYEQARPAASSVRFVQVVPRPTIKP